MFENVGSSKFNYTQNFAFDFLTVLKSFGKEYLHIHFLKVKLHRKN